MSQRTTQKRANEGSTGAITWADIGAGPWRPASAPPTRRAAEASSSRRCADRARRPSKTWSRTQARQGDVGATPCRSAGMCSLRRHRARAHASDERKGGREPMLRFRRGRRKLGPMQAPLRRGRAALRSGHRLMGRSASAPALTSRRCRLRSQTRERCRRSSSRRTEPTSVVLVVLSSRLKPASSKKRRARSLRR